MRRFTETMLGDYIELEQMVVDYWREVDENGGRNAPAFFTDDVTADFGAITFAGLDGVRKFYADRTDRISAEHQGGVRTTRHVFHNLQIRFDGVDRATLSFVIATYGAGGRPPIASATVPVAISDTWLECRRCSDGAWRIYRFRGEPIFLGEEKFAREALVGSPAP